MGFNPINLMHKAVRSVDKSSKSGPFRPTTLDISANEYPGRTNTGDDGTGWKLDPFKEGYTASDPRRTSTQNPLPPNPGGVNSGDKGTGWNPPRPTSTGNGWNPDLMGPPVTTMKSESEAKPGGNRGTDLLPFGKAVSGEYGPKTHAETIAARQANTKRVNNSIDELAERLGDALADPLAEVAKSPLYRPGKLTAKEELARSFNPFSNTDRTISYLQAAEERRRAAQVAVEREITRLDQQGHFDSVLSQAGIYKPGQYMQGKTNHDAISSELDITKDNTLDYEEALQSVKADTAAALLKTGKLPHPQSILDSLQQRQAADSMGGATGIALENMKRYSPETIGIRPGSLPRGALNGMNEVSPLDARQGIPLSTSNKVFPIKRTTYWEPPQTYPADPQAGNRSALRIGLDAAKAEAARNSGRTFSDVTQPVTEIIPHRSIESKHDAAVYAALDAKNKGLEVPVDVIKQLGKMSPGQKTDALNRLKKNGNLTPDGALSKVQTVGPITRTVAPKPPQVADRETGAGHADFKQGFETPGEMPPGGVDGHADDPEAISLSRVTKYAETLAHDPKYAGVSQDRLMEIAHASILRSENRHALGSANVKDAQANWMRQLRGVVRDPRTFEITDAKTGNKIEFVTDPITGEVVGHTGTGDKIASSQITGLVSGPVFEAGTIDRVAELAADRKMRTLAPPPGIPADVSAAALNAAKSGEAVAPFKNASKTAPEILNAPRKLIIAPGNAPNGSGPAWISPDASDREKAQNLLDWLEPKQAPSSGPTQPYTQPKLGRNPEETPLSQYPEVKTGADAMRLGGFIQKGASWAALSHNLKAALKAAASGNPIDLENLQKAVKIAQNTITFTNQQTAVVVGTHGTKPVNEMVLVGDAARHRGSGGAASLAERLRIPIEKVGETPVENPSGPPNEVPPSAPLERAGPASWYSDRGKRPTIQPLPTTMRPQSAQSGLYAMPGAPARTQAEEEAARRSRVTNSSPVSSVGGQALGPKSDPEIRDARLRQSLPKGMPSISELFGGLSPSRVNFVPAQYQTMLGKEHGFVAKDAPKPDSPKGGMSRVAPPPEDHPPLLDPGRDTPTPYPYVAAKDPAPLLERLTPQQRAIFSTLNARDPQKAIEYLGTVLQSPQPVQTLRPPSGAQKTLAPAYKNRKPDKPNVYKPRSTFRPAPTPRRTKAEEEAYKQYLRQSLRDGTAPPVPGTAIRTPEQAAAYIDYMNNQLGVGAGTDPIGAFKPQTLTAADAAAAARRRSIFYRK